MSIRTRGLTVLTVAVALAISGCGTTTPAAHSADANAPVVQATLTPSPGTPSGDPAATSAAKAPKAPGRTSGPGSTPVTPVTPAPAGKTKLALATPDKKGGPAKATTPALALTSYDRATGRAVLEPAKDTSGTKDAQDNEDTGNTTDAQSQVRPGQLIDSPPTPAAPRGALLAVTDVKPSDDGKTVVSTRPATLTELLGDSTANLRAALDPHNIEVKPQVKDLKVSFTKHADGAEGSVTGGLRLDTDTTVPLPYNTSVKLAGSLELDPTLAFSYQGALLSPRQASVGFDLDARATWRVGAAVTTPDKPIRIPLAKLAASPVVMVGHLPVVIHLDLTLYATIGVDGKVTLDTEQQITGGWGIHSAYTKGAGWNTDVEPGTLTVSPLRATLAGTASVRTGLDIEGSVALYDAVGMKAVVSPYLRAAVEGNATVTVGTSGVTPVVTGKAGLYGGIDIRGALMARIAVFGTPLFEKELPFPGYQREWPLATYSTPNGATASPRP